jgi:hypothetical protein
VDLVVLEPEPAGDPAGEGELVERALPEADGERGQPGAGAGGQRAEQAGVQAAREQQPDRDVRVQVGGDGAGQRLAQLGPERAQPAAGRRHRRGSRARHPLDLDSARGHVGDEHAARLELARAGEDRARRAHRVAREQLAERVRIELA